MKHLRKTVFTIFFACAGFFLLAVLLLAPTGRNPAVLGKARLSDGRIIQVEGLSYGTEHRIGGRSRLLEICPWLPARIKTWLTPKRPESTMHLDEPGLVVWVNALDAETGTNIDCQSLRLEFVDARGQSFGEDGSHWFGGQTFWRGGHSFHVFPRDNEFLRLRISTVLRKFASMSNASEEVRLNNPAITKPAPWTGGPLPQTQKIGDLEFSLTGLQLKVSGDSNRNWETRTIYWEPVSEFRRDGQPVGGWREPEWFAEDPYGNRGKYLGVHLPVLRYTLTVYPTETNTLAAIVVANLPTISLQTLTNEISWNQESTVASNKLTAIGCFPAGPHPFIGGNYITNIPGQAGVNPIPGGASSGWVGIGHRNALGKMEQYDSHFSPVPVIYLRTTLLGTTNRIGVRLRDEQGRYFTAKPDPRGYRQWIMPYLLELPDDVTNVVPEVVLLKPVTAVFTVNTGGPPPQ
jgi:hypothetical protein